MIVTGYVIKGRWRYLEHDWIAEEGSFVYEPPGEIHTLMVPEENDVVTDVRAIGCAGIQVEPNTCRPVA